MKKLRPKTTVAFILLVVAPLVSSYSFEEAISQESGAVPDYFIKVLDDSKTLEEKIARAHEQFKEEYGGNEFWYGYSFDLRKGFEFSTIEIHDDGGITISRNGDNWDQVTESDDLETHVLHALSELGDEKAKGEFEKRTKVNRDYGNAGRGLFFQVNSREKRIERIKLNDLYRIKGLRNYPVFWFDKVDNNESYDHLTAVVEDDHYSERIRKPAVVTIAMHDHPRVISFLEKTVARDRSFEIRESAVFWLGQIPEEESFESLVRIFDKERNSEMKEKIVFSFSQHESDNVINKLAEIARNDSDLDVREKAIFWLGQIGREESLDTLKEILESTKSTQLKEKVVFSISQHESQNAIPILIDVAENNKNREVREKAIFWLGQMAGKRTLEALGDIVENDEETEIKTKAVFAISQHVDKEKAIEMLMDIAKHNPNPEVRRKAIFWLGQTGDERVIDFFKEVLTD